jgi:hypothetical protein
MEELNPAVIVPWLYSVPGSFGMSAIEMSSAPPRVARPPPAVAIVPSFSA